MAEKKKKIEKDSETNDDKNVSFLKKSINFLVDDRTKAVMAIVIFCFTIFTLFSFISYLFTWQTDQSKLSISWISLISDENITVDNWAGKTGAFVSNLFINRWFGFASLSFLLFFVLIGFRLLNFKLLPFGKTTRYLIFLTLWVSVTLGYLFGDSWFVLGGANGFFISKWLNSAVGKIGTFFILAVTAFTFIIFVFRDALLWFKGILNKSKNAIIPPKISTVAPSEDTADRTFSDELADKKEDEIDNVPIIEDELPLEIENSEVEEELIDDGFEEVPTTKLIKSETPDEITLTVERKESEPEVEVTDIIQPPMGDFDPRLELSHYKFPPIDLLEDHRSSNSEVSENELVANKNKIIDTLKNYGIQIDKIKATIGPTVTLYEIVPAPGVKISKIRNLEDDIALSLAALGIRIIAPIPGKGTIGIEVPNLNPEIVSMRSVISSSKFQEAKFDLPVTLGKTIQNEVFVFDLTRSPHLLVAGATGQGKSVGLNAIITSLLYRKHPTELKFVLIDPKKIELSSYSIIEKHFLAKLPDSADAIITDVQKVKNTLRSLTIEMDTRYDLLKEAGGVRTIKEYNEKFLKRQLNPNKGHKFLPYIVVVIDEFADLIQTAGRDIEDPIARIAQLARAIGIHLIIATQRPSTNIITGSIKANFPSRLAFRVSSMIDSRTILDSPGANQLIGRGDLLISLGGDLVRVQCAFIDSPEITKLTEFIAKQQSPSHPFYLPEIPEEGEGLSSEGFDPNKKDELFADAARLIVQNQQGSTSLIQRRFSIGYTRAGRIIDQLEAAGIVGQYEGSKARQVLYKDLISLDQYLTQMGIN
jgi:S-DNA-T family DNA segregation ATPase FtsK/SpoIIIE